MSVYYKIKMPPPVITRLKALEDDIRRFQAEAKRHADPLVRYHLAAEAALAKQQIAKIKRRYKP